LAWWLIVVAAVALTAVSYLLRPKIKAPKPDAVKDLEDPVAQAGMPVPVPFGSPTIKGLNVLWFGEKQVRTVKQKAN
jgi:hypothetical protein